MKTSLLRILSAAFAVPIVLSPAASAQGPAAASPAPAAAAPAQAPAGFTRPAAHVNAPLGNIPRHLGDGTGSYKTGKYRDLFAEDGHPVAEINARLEKDFQQFFHGDAANERVYFEAGSNANGPLAYITDWANNDARTEGMSYGMMIAVQLNHKHEFDAIWNWSNTYMLITDPANPNVGYFAWSMNTDGTPRSTGPAPDGEEYYAMALLFAAHRWGNGQGIYNYQEQAERILRGMVHHPPTTGTGPFKIHPEDAQPFTNAGQLMSPNNYEQQQARADLAIEQKGAGQAAAQPGAGRRPGGPGGGFGGGNFTPRPTVGGPMMQTDYYMVRFVPGTGPGGNTDASYHLPGFYELFARWGPQEDRDFWLKAADVSRDMFPKVAGPKTGLVPDQNNYDETWMTGRDGQPTLFAYDAWRVISNWSFDYAWFHKDPDERVLSDRLQKFLVGQGISMFADRYTLDGKPMSTRHSVGMVAAAAAGGLAATPGPNEKAFVEELWRTPMPMGEQRYFDGMLYMFNMLHASGNFRIWMPQQ